MTRLLLEAAARRVARAVHAAVGRPLAWVLVIAALAGWPLVWSLRSRIPPPPPVLGTVAPFQLADAAGRPFGSRDLAGRVWVASFVSTTCGASCLSTTHQLGRIQARARHLEPALHLVSFGADPVHDTPERLASYARAHRASPRMWTFVAGREPELRAIAEDVLSPTEGVLTRLGPLPHGTRLVLVDGAARVRGRYDPGEPDAVDRLVLDAALLVNASAASGPDQGSEHDHPRE